MVNITSTIDITLKIPKNFKGIFPNTSLLTLAFTANTPKSVEEYVAEYYTKNKPHIFSYSSGSRSETFGSGSITVGTTRVQVPFHPTAKWIQFMNEDDGATATVYIGGADVSVENGWAALGQLDTSEKYYNKLKEMYLVSDEDDVTVKYLWGE